MTADLHVHTTYSDGIYRVEEILQFAHAAGIGYLSLTDHDTVAAYSPALAYLKKHSDWRLRLLTGIELSSYAADKDVHILGYGIDVGNDALNTATVDLRSKRKNRFIQMLEKVQQLGYNINGELVFSGERSPGRPHLAKALVEAGYFASVGEAFAVLLAKDRPGYLPQPKISLLEAIALIHGAGGKAVLAHPTEIGDDVLAEKLLAEVPFDGIEVWHPSAEPAAWKHWLYLAEKYRKLVSGGSDFHGHRGRYPEHLGEYTVSAENLQEVLRFVLPES